MLSNSLTHAEVLSRFTGRVFWAVPSQLLLLPSIMKIFPEGLRRHFTRRRSLLEPGSTRQRVTVGI